MNLLRRIWRWSFFVTLPVTIVFFVVMVNTAMRYYDFGLRHKAPSYIPFSLYNVGKMEFNHFLRSLELSVKLPFTRGFSKSAPLRRIDLFTSDSNIRELDSHLPYSGFKFKKGKMLVDDELFSVKLRYRGDSVYHWGYYKKSIRVKTKKSKLFNGIRLFNLLAPRDREIINNHLSYRLADRMGLIAPYSEMVNVNINGRPFGIYTFVEQMQEITLRRNGFMPGDLYVGDWIGKEHYSGIDNQVFDHPGLWKKFAINNHYPEESIEPLKKLIKLIKTPSSEAMQRELGNMLDMELWGRWSAFQTFTQTFHRDSTHNWIVYYDPARSKFFPVIWDPVGWHRGYLPPKGALPVFEILASPFHLQLFKNADFRRARLRALQGFFSSGEDEEFLTEVDEIIDSLEAHVGADPHLVDAVKMLRPKTVVSSMKKLKNDISKVLSEVKREYLPVGDAIAYATGKDGELLLRVKGRVPLHRILLKYDKAITGDLSASITHYGKRGAVTTDVSGDVQVFGDTVEVTTMLLSSFEQSIAGMEPHVLRKNHVVIRPGFYELRLNGPQKVIFNEPLSVTADLGMGQVEPAKKLTEISRSAFSDSYVVVAESPLKEPLLWSGDITIRGVTIIDKDVVILAGSTIRMAPGASLLFKGRLTAEGTQLRPISFIPLSSSTGKPDDAWGAVVLLGRGADGSSIRQVSFAGGSGLKGALYEYSAMLSIHDVKDVVIEKSRFSNNKVVDDMFHAVYSELIISDCTFANSLSDAVDLDYVKGTVENSRFTSSGNDAIDLMSSVVAVTGSFISGSGDKGISIGEGTEAFVWNTTLKQNAIGVQVKDSSTAHLYNVELYGNNKSIDAYRKNWQYGDGGHVSLYKSVVRGIGPLITADKASDVKIFDSFVEGLTGKKKGIYLDETVDSESDSKAKNPEERYSFDMRDFLMPYQELVVPQRRGTL